MGMFENAKTTGLPSYLALKIGDIAHPRDVITDEELDPMEKRAILAAWASDQSAVESRPEFRWLKGTPGPVLLRQILSALRALDGETQKQSAIIAAMMAGNHGRGANP